MPFDNDPLIARRAAKTAFIATTLIIFDIIRLIQKQNLDFTGCFSTNFTMNLADEKIDQDFNFCLIASRLIS